MDDLASRWGGRPGGLDSHVVLEDLIAQMASKHAILLSLCLLSVVSPSPAQNGDAIITNMHIDIALRAIERGGSWAAGWGCLLSWVPGTSAKDLELALRSVKASIWAYEVSTRCMGGPCPSPERNLIQQGLDAEFNQCVSPDRLLRNLSRRRLP